MSGFKKAVKAKSKLRLAIFGPSGGGKTMTALRIAVGMLAELNESGGDTGNGRIALIDTEYGSASLYGDRYDFDACELDDKTIDGYVEAMRQAAREHYPILVVDSGSHAWQELLEEVDHLAKTK
ncbi:MAG: AAA family ATPase, partial [Dehalococcoidales bacterium]